MSLWLLQHYSQGNKYTQPLTNSMQTNSEASEWSWDEKKDMGNAAPVLAEHELWRNTRKPQMPCTGNQDPHLPTWPFISGCLMLPWGFHPGCCWEMDEACPTLGHAIILHGHQWSWWGDLEHIRHNSTAFWATIKGMGHKWPSLQTCQWGKRARRWADVSCKSPTDSVANLTARI